MLASVNLRFVWRIDHSRVECQYSLENCTVWLIVQSEVKFESRTVAQVVQYIELQWESILIHF